MDENSSSEIDIVSVENKQAYSDCEESIDDFLKILELIEEIAEQLDVELSEAINEVNVVEKIISKRYMRFLWYFEIFNIVLSRLREPNVFRVKHLEKSASQRVD